MKVFKGQIRWREKGSLAVTAGDQKMKVLQLVGHSDRKSIRQGQRRTGLWQPQRVQCLQDWDPHKAGSRPEEAMYTVQSGKSNLLKG